jgi:type IX secretion system substrate protein
LRKNKLMKKLLFAIAFAILPCLAQAQLTLDQTYTNTSNIQIVLFSSNGTKIMVVDTGSTQVNFYNTDYTLWKTVNVPAYPGYKFTGNVYAISDNLFNSDNLVEMIASYSVPTGSYPYTLYESQSFNESGTVLQDFGSAASFGVHDINGNYKLFANAYYNYTTKIYSFPGTMPCGQCGALGVEMPKTNGNTNGDISQAIPNPSNNQVTINYNLPPGAEANLILVNTTGQTVKSIPVNSSANSVTIDNTNLPAGVYYYNLSGSGIPSTGNKMIIVK